MEARQLRAWEMLSNGSEIKRVNESLYRVNSQSGNGFYHVTRQGPDWSCECLDYVNRQVACKHIYAVYFSQKFRQHVTSKNLGLEVPASSEDYERCLRCGSLHIEKWGWRYHANGRSQRYRCMICKRRWDAKNSGFEKMRVNPHAITVALDLYFKGVSLRKIVDHLKQFEGVNISHVAVLKWIQKYVVLMRDYVDTLKPELSRVFHADETKVNIRGQWVWLWHLMDGDTRFLLANHVSQGRTVADACEAFHEAKEIGKTQPRAILTDGLSSYPVAAQKEFPNAIHVSNIGLQARMSNNRMERYHGTFKERNKTMRSIKKPDSAIFDGQRIYYNHIRPHQALEGKTPAEAAGLNLKLVDNKVEVLIRQAATSQRHSKEERNQ